MLNSNDTLNEQLRFLQIESKRLFETLRGKHGNAYQFEAVTTNPAPELGIDDHILKDIQSFIDSNPMLEKDECPDTEGQYQIIKLKESYRDLFRHRLDAFNATWILSFLWLNRKATTYGVKEIVDVTGGDGRGCFFAYDVRSVNIEIDSSLISVQEEIEKKTERKIEVHCDDCTGFNFNRLELTKPVFYVVGVTTYLAPDFLDNLRKNSLELLHNSLFIFNAPYQNSSLFRDLELLEEVKLPTYWKPEATYSFVRFKR
jgi:hypothetical protein